MPLSRVLSPTPVAQGDPFIQIASRGLEGHGRRGLGPALSGTRRLRASTKTNSRTTVTTASRAPICFLPPRQPKTVLEKTCNLLMSNPRASCQYTHGFSINYSFGKISLHQNFRTTITYDETYGDISLALANSSRRTAVCAVSW